MSTQCTDSPARKQKSFNTRESASPPKSILLLEDEADFAEIVREYLESCGYSVTAVPDGIQGMHKIMEKDFDVILCDLLMPNLPGDMFYLGVERVKPHLAGRFIFITGHQDHPMIAKFVSRARALTLLKPFGMEVLIERINSALKHPQKLKLGPALV